MREGTVLALMTSVLWGITPILDKIGVGKASPSAVMAIRFTTTFFCVIPLFFLPRLRSEIVNLDSRTVGCIVSAAILSAIMGITMYFMAMKTMEATQVTPICASYPLMTFVLGVIILHEPLTLMKTLGTILTVAGVVLLSL